MMAVAFNFPAAAASASHFHMLLKKGSTVWVNLDFKAPPVNFANRL